MVELNSLDYAFSYHHAFVYIRQLVLYLRSALKKSNPKSLRTVYCWKYVHCLRLWLAVLVAACLSEEEESEGGPVYRYHCYYYHRNYEEVSGRGCQDDEIPGLPPGGDRPFNAVEREEV